MVLWLATLTSVRTLVNEKNKVGMCNVDGCFRAWYVALGYTLIKERSKVEICNIDGFKA